MIQTLIWSAAFIGMAAGGVLGHFVIEAINAATRRRLARAAWSKAWSRPRD